MKKPKVIPKYILVESICVDWRGGDFDYISNKMDEIKQQYPGLSYTYECENVEEWGSESLQERVNVTRLETLEEAVARMELDVKKEKEWTLNTIEHLKMKLQQLESKVDE